MFSNIRVRLTLWYVLTFGSLLIAFSTYIYSSLSSEMRRRFDASLLRNAKAIATHFNEIVVRNNVTGGADRAIREFREGREAIAIFREDQLLASTGEDVTTAIAAMKVLDASESHSEPLFATESEMNKRLVVVPFQEGGQNYRVAILEPLDKLEGEIGRMRNIILFGLPAALALTALGGFFLARKSLAPIVTISEQAEHIGAQNLHERLRVRNPDDELGRLAEVFNALLSRLDTSFRVMREFMADASHELRTPITIIHGEAEVSLSQNLTSGEYRQSLGVIRDQSRRMAHIVSDMLALARADSGEHRLRVEELYLNDLVEECCRAAKSLALKKGLRLNYKLDEDISLRGDEELLKRMVVNLLDNAIRYTPAEGSVYVTLTTEQSRARLVVADTGIGIPPESVGRVCDRFYRVDDTRARASGGSGLGLSIVKLAAESHGGSVDLISQPGHGSTFTVFLPCNSTVHPNGDA